MNIGASTFKSIAVDN